MRESTFFDTHDRGVRKTSPAREVTPRKAQFLASFLYYRGDPLGFTGSR